jgi:hypothetical protein
MVKKIATGMNEDDYPAGYLDRGLDAVITPKLADWKYKLRGCLDQISGKVDKRAAKLATKIKWYDVRSDRPTILCLDRALFRKDVAELRRRLPCNFVDVKATSVKKFQEPWIPPQWRRQTFFGGYLAGPIRSYRRVLSRFGTSFLRRASQIHRIDAVMAANTDYWQDDAIRDGCRELGIPFLVLSRENYLWPTEVKMVHLQYKLAGFRYGGAGVAVASAPTRDALVEIGSFAEGAVWLTGWPRFDAWRDGAKIPFAERNTVTLFSYGDPLYLAPQSFEDVLTRFIAMANERRGQYRFVLKVKKQNEIALHYERHQALQGAPVDVISEEPLPELLSQSKAVIGYNSTAVVEALLSGAGVIVPTWADSKRSAEDSGLHYSKPGDRDVAFFPESADELTRTVNGLLDGSLAPIGDATARLQRFSEYSHVEEGRLSSELVGEFIDHYVSKHSKPWRDRQSRGA